STHGESILNSARIVARLDDAINDCVLVVGTTGHSGGTYRQQNVGTPDAIMPHVVEVLRQGRPAALLFGPEPTGLSNEIVTRCQYLIQIPTAEAYPSLNLAQAVAICIYELNKAWRLNCGSGHSCLAGQTRMSGPTPDPLNQLADVQVTEHMFRQLQTALE